MTPDARANAVALSYRADDSAPRVVAKGQGLVAEEIIRRAREAGVYVHQSRELVGMLMNVDLDRQIPQELYVVVAELLAWLHRTEKSVSRNPAGARTAQAARMLHSAQFAQSAQLNGSPRPPRKADATAGPRMPGRAEQSR